jgi:ABC-type Fe3+ transport system substrate-binding protein
MKKTISAIALFGALLGSAAAQEKLAITPDLVAKAKAEGQVTLLYGSPLITMQAIVADFNKTYPDVKVNLERRSGAQGAQSVIQEGKAGVRRVDVVQSTEVESGNDMIKAKLFVSYVPSNIDDFKPIAKGLAPYLYAPSTIRSIVMYNPKQVTDAEVEKLRTWTGVLDPVFKGRISVVEPSIGGAAAPLLYIMNTPALGEDFLKKLKAQKPAIYLNSTLGREAATSSQQAISIFSQFDSIAMSDFQRGSPVRFLYPNPTVEYAGSSWGFLACAPHPNAARLLTAWILSREGGLAFQGPLSNSRSTLTNLEDTRTVLAKLRQTSWFKEPTDIWFPDMKDWTDNFGKYQDTWLKIMKGSN